MSIHVCRVTSYFDSHGQGSWMPRIFFSSTWSFDFFDLITFAVLRNLCPLLLIICKWDRRSQQPLCILRCLNVVLHLEEQVQIVEPLFILNWISSFFPLWFMQERERENTKSLKTDQTLVFSHSPEMYLLVIHCVNETDSVLCVYHLSYLSLFRLYTSEVWNLCLYSCKRITSGIKLK